MFIHRLYEFVPLGVSVRVAHLQLCVWNIPTLGGNTAGELKVLHDDQIWRPRIALHHQVGKPQPWDEPWGDASPQQFTTRDRSVSLAYSCISGVAKKVGSPGPIGRKLKPEASTVEAKSGVEANATT
jgi:hypothetical protein